MQPSNMQRLPTSVLEFDFPNILKMIWLFWEAGFTPKRKQFLPPLNTELQTTVVIRRNSEHATTAQYLLNTKCTGFNYYNNNLTLQ